MFFPDDGQPGSYRFVRRISTEKALVFTNPIPHAW